MNDQGVALADRISNTPYSRLRLVGFFDDRDQERLAGGDRFAPLGRLGELPEFVKSRTASSSSTCRCRWPRSRASCRSSMPSRTPPPRSTSFPDMFITDLIQGRSSASAACR